MKVLVVVKTMCGKIISLVYKFCQHVLGWRKTSCHCGCGVLTATADDKIGYEESFEENMSNLN
jgi:hypothetical protein